MYNDEEGTADDDDASIQTKFVSKEFVANNPTGIKNFRQVVVYGEMTVSTVLTASAYVDDILVSQKDITADDIPLQSSVEKGGIATDAIGNFIIGDDGENSATFSTRQEFTKRLNIRKTGKKLRIEITSDGTNNDFDIQHLQYSFLQKTQFFNPIIEK